MNQLHRNVPLLAVCTTLMMSGSFLLFSSSALIGNNLASDLSLATLPMALQFVATMLTSLPAAWLMQRLGRKPAFLLASLFAMTGAALAVLAIIRFEFWWFVTAAICIGIFNGFGNYFRFVAADSVTNSLKSKAVSLVMLGGLLAAFVGPNLARFARQWIVDAEFAAAYLVMIALYAAMFVVMLFLRIDDATKHENSMPEIARPLRAIIAQAKFKVALLCGMLGYGMMALVMTVTPLSMHAHDMMFDDISVVIQWHVVAMFAPSFFTGTLIARFGVLRVMAAGVLCGLGSVAVSLAGESFVHYLLALILLGLSWNFMFVGATALLTETYNTAEKNKVQALNDFIVFSVVAASSLSAGALLNHFGWRVVNLGMLPLLLLALASIGWLALQNSKHKGQVNPVTE